MVAAAIGAAVSTTVYGLIENAAVQIAARMLWGISYASLNLATLAYAVSDRPNAGKRGRRQPGRDRHGAGDVAGGRRWPWRSA
jgi:hypothetical protein